MNRPIYYLLTLSFLCLQSFSPSLFAINPVTTVWRADLRRPEIIFKEGFHPWGTNNALADHTLGVSVATGGFTYNPPTSQFISTSAHTTGSEDDFSKNILKIIYLFNRPEETWVYDINPDENFYNTEESLRAFLASREGQSLSEEEKQKMNGAIDIAVEQNEWVSLGAIPPERIRGARRWIASRSGETNGYGFSITHWRAEGYIRNPLYDRRTLQSNSNPYPHVLQQHIPNEADILVSESASGNFGAAGFCQESVAGSSSTNTSHRERRDTQRNQYCRLVNPREEMIKKLMPILSYTFKSNLPKPKVSKKPVHDEL